MFEQRWLDELALMRVHSPSAPDVARVIVIGLITAAVTAAVMFIGIKSGVSPLPKPLALAFVQTLFGPGVPIPVGFAFHAAWVTFFTFVYVMLFRESLNFAPAFWLAFLLWVSVLVIFFPLVGWGFFGIAVSPALIVASALPHLLFAVLIWGFSRFLLERREEQPPRSEPI